MVTATPTGGAQPGTVTKISGNLWAIVPDGEPSQRYCLDGPLATGALTANVPSNSFGRRYF
jgi:hypothetical protein